MSSLTGFDSDAVGFECVSQDARPNKSSGSQTTEFGESGTGSQTNTSKNIGCMVYPEDLNAQEDALKEYPPPGLNEFLRRVAPAMMEQLDQNDKDFLNNSSDEDEEEVLTAKLLQEIKLKDGSGDHRSSVLGVSWSSSGSSLAVSVGQLQHDAWCESPGLIKVYSLKRSEDRFVHTLDIAEKNCVTVLKYHPSLAALLAYGTSSGEVVLCNLRSGGDAEATLTSPAGCHGCRRVAALLWADAPLANVFLMMQISCKGKRRGAADQVLFSAGADGTLVAWQVNPTAQVFESVVGYSVTEARHSPADLTCFDFIRKSPLQPVHEKTPDDVFVVGSKTGKLFLCKIQSPASGERNEACDPVYDVLEGHPTCVLDVVFSTQKPGVFVSISMDSELRVYDIAQGAPLKVLCLEAPISCMSWVSPPCLVVGLGGGEELLRVYNVCSGRVLPVGGLLGRSAVSCVAVNQSGSCRIAAGDDSGTVRVWELPTRRIKLSAHDLDF